MKLKIIEEELDKQYELLASCTVPINDILYDDSNTFVFIPNGVGYFNSTRSYDNSRSYTSDEDYFTEWV